MPRPRLKPRKSKGGDVPVALSDLASTLSASIKQIIIDIVEFLTPIITVICVGMIIIGAVLIALRQEFYGIRLIIGGGIGLAILYLVIPLLLGFLP
jgi:hypothetical protein